jgi:hypothetical protein
VGHREGCESQRGEEQHAIEGSDALVSAGFGGPR